MLNIQHQTELRRFSLTDGGEEIGELEYRLNGRQMEITHTCVNPKYRGQGLARRLVNAAVAEADHTGLSLSASCDYAEEILARAGRLNG